MQNAECKMQNDLALRAMQNAKCKMQNGKCRMEIKVGFEDGTSSESFIKVLK